MAEATMRILMVHASKRGGTAELAKAIALALTKRGMRIDTVAAVDNPDPSSYDAVIVGSAIYHERWLGPAASYAKQHAAALRSKPVWLFSSGPIDNTARDGSLAPVPQVMRIARDLEICGHITFGGCFDSAKASLADRIWAHGRHGDFRDQDEVEEWAYHVAAALAARAAATPQVKAALPKQRAARTRTATKVDA